MSCFTGMMRWMAVISTDQQQILRELKAIRGMISARKVTEEEDIEFTSLPLTSDVELQLFEEDLKDKKKEEMCGMYNILCFFLQFLLGKIL